jgi:Transposase
VAAPGQVNVWVGLDVGKKEHFADVLDDEGERLFARAVTNDQADLEALLDRAPGTGRRRWSSTSPARSPSWRWPWLPAAACRWRMCRAW